MKLFGVVMTLKKYVIMLLALMSLSQTAHAYKNCIDGVLEDRGLDTSVDYSNAKIKKALRQDTRRNTFKKVFLPTQAIAAGVGTAAGFASGNVVVGAAVGAGMSAWGTVVSTVHHLRTKRSAHVARSLEMVQSGLYKPDMSRKEERMVRVAKRKLSRAMGRKISAAEAADIMLENQDRIFCKSSDKETHFVPMSRKAIREVAREYKRNCHKRNSCDQ
jgi:hypothetical protein